MLLNNLEFSNTQKIHDDGNIISIKLKPINELLLDNLFNILLGEISLVFLVYLATSFIYIACSISKIPFYDLYTIILFIIPHLIIIFKLAFIRNFIINKKNNEFVVFNNIKTIKYIKITELDKIMVSKKVKLVKAGKYNREYTLTTWEVYLIDKHKEKIFLTKFINKDDASESKRLLSSFTSSYTEETRQVLNSIFIFGYDKVFFDNFWSDTGEKIKNLVTKLADSLNLKLELLYEN
ncbi:MAG: hypothetical protein U0457_13025 [Candidatus Sericytochromatia bacterium]